jgi:hypothetical protein
MIREPTRTRVTTNKANRAQRPRGKSAMKTAALNRVAGTHQAPGLCGAMVAMWRAVRTDLFNSYRPEKHYMRGPGPKWRARHARSEAPDSDRVDGHCPAT